MEKTRQRCRLLLAGCLMSMAGLGIAGPASASFLVHDTPSAFIDPPERTNPGMALTGSRPPPAQRDPANIFDLAPGAPPGATNISHPDLFTSLSLGIGGTLTLQIDPLGAARTIASVQIIESNIHHITGNVVSYKNSRERAELYLSMDGTNWEYVATLLARGYLTDSGGTCVAPPETGTRPCGPRVDGTGSALYLSSTVSTSKERDVFTIDLLTDDTPFLWLQIRDTSSDTGTNTVPLSGFDIGSLAVTSVLIEPQPIEPVPEPLALSLFGLGLAGLGLARRRRAG